MVNEPITLMGTASSERLQLRGLKERAWWSLAETVRESYGDEGAS